MLFTLGSCLTLLQALLLLSSATASPIIQKAAPLRNSTTLSDADPSNARHVFVDINEEKDHLGINMNGPWFPGKSLDFTAYSIFDGQPLFFGRRQLVLGEAMIVKVNVNEYQVRVTFVDLSATSSRLLAIYVDGQIEGKSWHKSTSVGVPWLGAPGAVPDIPSWDGTNVEVVA